MTARPHDISVVIPTFNRPDKLAACLAALARQSFARDRFEVIVVDDGGSTPLEPVVSPFRDRLHVRLITQPNAGPATARNTGAREALGTILAFTDDDCEPDAEWLSALHRHMLEQPNGLIGGHTVNALPDNVCSTASQLLIDYLYSYHSEKTSRGASDGPVAPPFFTSNNFAVATDRFAAVGGFAESFPLAAGEDRELCDRWQAHGWQLARAPEAVIRHAHWLSLSTFWRQHLNYGRGAFHLRQARIINQRPTVGLEPLSFYTRLVTYPLRAATRKRLRLMGLLCVSQVANVLGFALEKSRAGPARSSG